MFHIGDVEIKPGLCFKHRRRNAGEIEHFVTEVNAENVTFRRGYRHPETLAIDKFKKIFEKEVVSPSHIEAAYLEHHYFVLKAALGDALDLRALWEDMKSEYEDPYDYYDPFGCSCNCDDY